MGEATCSTVRGRGPRDRRSGGDSARYRPANDARDRRRGVRPADRLAPDPYQCKTPTRVPFGADCGTETPVSMIAMGGISLF